MRGPVIAAAALFLCGSFAQAQQPSPPPAEPAPRAEPGLAQPITDDELETFADIYVELEKALSTFEEELAAAENEQQAQEAQARMQQKSFDTIAEHGWTPTQYNRVVQAVNNDPNLLQKAVALIEDRRS
ncbi:MAG: DUF4168 domain-containing protein [Gammaproteobacteria bacterium]